MSLNVQEIKSFLPSDKPYKRYDSGGLYLLVKPNGSKLWQFKYRFGGIEKKMPFGAFPEIGLAEARKRRDRARISVADGIDPMRERKREKAKIRLGAENTFAVVANSYIEHKMVGEGRAEATLKKARWFLELLTPAIGNMPLDDLDPQMMLAALKKLEARGNLETAKKCRSFSSRVFRYGAALGLCKSDPTAILQGALITPKARHYAAILEPDKLGQLLRAIDDFECYPVTKLALKIAPHIFVRPGELRHGDWSELDWDKAIWTIPAGKMKARRTHAVPLSRQVLELFRELHSVTIGTGYMFPAFHTWKRPMSENTINASFRRMGFTKDEMTAHGFRSTASTLLNESGLWHPDAIERALAHGDSNAIRGTYNRGQY
ncbi:phage integrase central domain-containing protein [Croceicoccus sp. BE223]|uniref:tyrosine-type recombinase/integrase n=1 Tax=Croceicoccus sp. BE223 TaxID=2817716 RepID=UPI002863D405|nr:integrase arm-type DNA-binding domain-containing protein [Croceicoccus sp. BE223]MDR7101036.1 integrase [Croceicoccus sp. BE223]